MNCLHLIVSVYEFPITYVTSSTFLEFLIYNVCLVTVISVNGFNVLLFQSFTILIIGVDMLFAESTTYVYFIPFVSLVNLVIVFCSERSCQC